jgi:hypothetical protein
MLERQLAVRLNGLNNTRTSLAVMAGYEAPGPDYIASNLRISLEELTALSPTLH